MSDSRSLPAIVDTHLHLDEPDFDKDRDAVLDAARQAGVVRFINIGHVPERWESSRALRERHADVDIALGVHPQDAERYDPALDRALRAAVREVRPVAIGETGFDFFRQNPSRTSQERAFRAQLDLAAEFSLPIVIHQRNASDALLETLKEWPGVAPIVLHSFDGTERLATWAISRGCFFGVGGLATRPGAGALRDTLGGVPTGRLLLETDAPYLAPPGIRDRRNVPANLPRIAALLAPIWGLTEDQLCEITSDNANAVFAQMHTRR